VLAILGCDESVSQHSNPRSQLYLDSWDNSVLFTKAETIGKPCGINGLGEQKTSVTHL